MAVFELILCIIAAVVLSSFLSRFIPKVSTPLVQIALGALASQLPFFPDVTLSPELFMVLFIAPLLYLEAHEIDKSELIKSVKLSLSLAIGLAIATMAAVGFALHAVWPAIPLAAALALGAALGPTDAVAVSSLGKEAALTQRQTSVLKGESLFGGAFFGIVVGMVADVVFETMRSLGWETMTTRILMELFLPFILYLGAEAVHVSGILSVVAAGLLIRFDRTGIGPNVARTNIVSSSVWGVLSFSLNGTVFILLGMLLPSAMTTSWDDPHVSNWLLLTAILVVSAVVIVMRFLWISLMLRLARDTETGKRRKMTAKRWRSAAVMTFGGPKGTITLSLMFTIPYTLAAGANFPMRNELIFIAGGVIVVTLLLANFLLPLLAPNRNKDNSTEMTEITIEVLRRTVEELSGRVTQENRRAVLMIIDSYTKRITRLKQRTGEINPQGYMQLQIDALNWEKEYVKNRLAGVRAAIKTNPTENRAANNLEAEACERLLDQIMSSLRHIETAHNSGRMIWRVKGRYKALQRRMGTLAKRVNSRIRRTTPLFSDDELFAHTRVVQVDAIEHVIDRLYEEMGGDTYNTEHCSGLLLDYRRSESALRARPNMGISAEAQEQAEEVKRESYGIELGVIQDMYEAGDITRAQSKQLRRNVYVMSVDADAQI